MLKSNYEFEVLVHGSSAKEYYHQGSYYIEAKESTKFSLRMRNNSSNRVLFVPTVDGLSIMSGKEASFKSNGYIIDAHSSTTIDGWRTSDDKVAEFFFSSPKESYAKKISKGGNLGVIGCAVFKEKERVKVIEKIVEVEKYIPYPVYPSCPQKHYPDIQPPQWTCISGLAQTCDYNTSATSAGISNLVSTPTSSSFNAAGNSVSAFYTSAVPEAGLGTGFGEDKYSPVVTVDFDKESSPTEVFSMFYNTRKNLESMGIEFRKPVYVNNPSAFPSENGYCKRPD